MKESRPAKEKRRPKVQSRSKKEAAKAEKRRLTVKEKGQTKHLFDAIKESTFIVFDIETTGGNPDRNGITEIFALKVVKGKVVDTFYSLVNPKIRIPPIVRRMTGITNQMVRNEPTIDKVMPGFVDFIEDHVLVSHNTIGDMRFLRYYSHQTVGTMVDNYFLCTHLLTEKLLSDAPDKSLKGLAENLDLETQGKLHRAEADAYLTYELFKVLIGKLFEREIHIVVDAVRFQGDYESSMRLGWGITLERLRGLPSAPGVFYLHDRRGRVVFLSSAQDIAKEVKSLTRVSYLPKQLVKTVLLSTDVSYETSAAMFAATLQEAKSLADEDLKYKPCDWHQRVAHFVYLRREGKGKDFVLGTGTLEPGVVVARGPIKSGREVGPFIDRIGEIFGKKMRKKGMILNSTEASIVESLLRDGIQSTVSLPLFPPLLFWPSYRHKWRKEVEQIRQLKQLKIPGELKMCQHTSGVLGVPLKEGWQLYTIAGGIPRAEAQFEGDLEEDLLYQEGRRFLGEIEKAAQKFHRKPMNAWEAYASNRVFWWLGQGAKKSETFFLSLEQLKARGSS